jgi:hypothetical protein
VPPGGKEIQKALAQLIARSHGSILGRATPQTYGTREPAGRRLPPIGLVAARSCGPFLPAAGAERCRTPPETRAGTPACSESLPQCAGGGLQCEQTL